MSIESRADTIDMSGQAPYERCGICHEYDGNTRMDGFPRLAGQTRAYLQKQLGDFRSGKRRGNMQSVAELLSDAEIEAVADYFSAQGPTLPPIRQPVDTRLGEQIFFQGKQQPRVPACAACHGERGKGLSETPRLANQLPSYLLKQLQDFKTGQRDNDVVGVMRYIARSLSEVEINSLAGFLAGIPVDTKH